MAQHFLAIETSTTRCDVALLSCGPGAARLAQAAHEGVAEHAEHVLTLVDAVLDQAGIARHALSAIAFGQGPGGFTGLRLACGVAQGMAFGLGLPVLAVPSPLAMAETAARQSAARPGALHVCVQDARMGEVYLAAYRVPATAAASWPVCQAPVLIDAAHAADWLLQHLAAWQDGQPGEVVVCGDGLAAHAALATALAPAGALRMLPDARPEAGAVARLARDAHARGEGTAPDAAMPLYVRDKVAFTTAERAQGAGGNPRVADRSHEARVVPTLDAMHADDLDTVAAIESRVQSFPWSRRNFADGLQAGYPAWVARLDGRVVGFCMLLLAPDVAHLLVIGVDPRYQGRGVGRALLQRCEDQARADGLDVMVLEVRQSNLKAIGFYRHQGYAVFSERKDYYPAAHGRREPACVMQKRLPGKAGPA